MKSKHQLGIAIVVLIDLQVLISTNSLFLAIIKGFLGDPYHAGCYQLAIQEYDGHEPT